MSVVCPPPFLPLLSWQALQVDWLIVLPHTESKADSLTPAPAFTDPGLGERREARAGQGRHSGHFNRTIIQ